LVLRGIAGIYPVIRGIASYISVRISASLRISPAMICFGRYGLALSTSSFNRSLWMISSVYIHPRIVPYALLYV
jgi:hypothetical protein